MCLKLITSTGWCIAAALSRASLVLWSEDVLCTSGVRCASDVRQTAHVLPYRPPDVYVSTAGASAEMAE